MPLFCNDLRAVEDVLMYYAVDIFACSDTIFVVGIRIRVGIEIQIFIRVDTCSFTEYVACQLSAIPSELNITAVGFGIADLERVADTVVNDICAVELRELIAPRAVTRVDSALEACTRCGFAGAK